MKILVTGAAGTLGRAFVKLLVSEGQDVVALDNNEWSLAQLKNDFPDISIVLKDFGRIDHLPKVDAIVHLAAYKHVNFGEDFVGEFVRNDLVKTMHFMDVANRSDIPLLFMSTDKAVEPCSVYGYCKAIAESHAKNLDFAVARCGNLLSSSGSVIPTWEKQIENKEPVTITDERMVRYVIEDYDAANQLWQEFKKGTKLIIPKMNEVRIMDLLTDVLKRHGYDSPDDYEPGVTVIGMRPGEKLREKLKWDNEQ